MDSEQTPAQEWAEIGGGFTARVECADPSRWDDPAPVSGWRARDVVGHLVEWFPGFLAFGAGVHLEVSTSIEDDPVGAWRELDGEVTALLADPATPNLVLSNPHIGDVPLDQAVSRFFVGDVFMHTWDLARATGQDERLDPQRCALMLAGMEPMADVMRSSGQYGPVIYDAPPDADPQTRLLAFIGRDPRP